MDLFMSTDIRFVHGYFYVYGLFFLSTDTFVSMDTSVSTDTPCLRTHRVCGHFVPAGTACLRTLASGHFVPTGTVRV